MSIAYPLTLPVAKFKAGGLTANDTTAKSTSPYTRQSQVYVFPGQWWSSTISLAAMKPADYEAMVAFFLKLRGRSGSFLFGDPARPTPRGTAKDTPGTPLVNGAGQTGASVTIDGCPVSSIGYLKAGDYVQFGAGATARLHKLLDDVNTDSGGNAVLSFWPDLRESPADNSAVVVTGAKGVFRRSDDSMPWQTDNGGIAQNIVVGIEEVL